MRVYNDLNNLPEFRNAVLTIGSFDGVHHGHQQILKKVKDLAKKAGGESIVVTFHPHPRLVIYPQDDTLRLISTIDEKVALLKRYGIDNVVVVPFTYEFSRQTADEYIQKFLLGKFNPKCIVIGYDHRFGLNRQGDINYLKYHGKKAGFNVVKIQKQEIQEVAVSSSKIRVALEKGDVKTAGKLLNHYYHLTGTVVRGQQIGSTIGFPTANLQINNKHKLIPPDGIYAVYVEHKKQRYQAMMYMGNRPTLDKHDNHVIEVNIFDFDQDLYGEKLKVELVDYLRDDAKFDGLDGLKNQLREDKINSRKTLDEENKIKLKEEEPMMPSVAVVILNYNTRDQLKKFLPTVIESEYPNLQIIVADNGSKDGSLTFLQKSYAKQVQVIDLKENHGFAKGYNLALEKVDAEYFILLNSDVEVTKNWILPIIETFQQDETIGAVQPKIKAFHRKVFMEHAGASGGYIDKWGYPFCRGRIFSKVEQDYGQYDSIQEVFWASGAAMFVRSRLFKDLNGFDADYFAHMEEIDFCWRLKRAGFKVMVNPKSEVFHVGGGTLKYESPFKTYLNFRNSLFTLIKNKPTKQLFWLIPLRLILDGIAGMMFLIQGKFAHLQSILKAHFAMYANFRKFSQKRHFYNDLIEKISIGDDRSEKGTFQKSIVFQFYLKRKKEFSKLDF
ncbi:MAG: riboflavin kinase/FMN adenylyltransferase [Paraglaciecola sp.]|jgi:riboflavin kinase/FMN adenylyltransferase